MIKSTEAEKVFWDTEDVEMMWYDLETLCCERDMHSYLFYGFSVEDMKTYLCPMEISLDKGCAVTIPTGYIPSVLRGYEISVNVADVLCGSVIVEKYIDTFRSTKGKFHGYDYRQGKFLLQIKNESDKRVHIGCGSPLCTCEIVKEEGRSYEK